MAGGTERPKSRRVSPAGLLAAVLTAIVFGSALVRSGPPPQPPELVALVVLVSIAAYVMWVAIEPRLRPSTRRVPPSPDYGPSARAVARFIERAGRLSLEEARRLSSLETATDPGDRAAARDALKRAAELSGRESALRAGGEAVTSVATAWYQGSIVATFAMDTALADTIAAAMPALRDAVGALVVRDLLRPEEFETLHGPWAAVTAGRDPDRRTPISGSRSSSPG